MGEVSRAHKGSGLGWSSRFMRRSVRHSAGMRRRRFLFLAGMPFAGLAVPGLLAEPKLKPSEIVNRHLESLGSEHIRSQILHREAHGSCRKFGRIADVRGSTFVAGGVYRGRIDLLCSISYFRINMLFDSNEYPVDSIIFDGEDVKAALFGANRTGRLAQYLANHSFCLKEGLFGGALSLDWLLLRSENKLGRFHSSGKKKFKGQNCQKVRYRLSAAEHSITLYFSSETGCHLGTDYGVPPAGIFAGYGGRAETERIVESFSNFQQHDGLTLPTFWEIELYRRHGKERWEAQFQSFSHQGPQLLRD